MNSDYRKIRQQLYRKHPPYHNLIPVTVSYQTTGTILIIGPEDLIRLASGQFDSRKRVTLLATEPISRNQQAYLEHVMQQSQSQTVYYAKLHSISGFLGQFNVLVEQQGSLFNLAEGSIQKPHFDLIIDLGQSVYCQAPLLPVGYFHPASDDQALQKIIDSIDDYIGEFEKPRYVSVEHKSCAHSRNDLSGCTRCVDVCSADAIRVVDNNIDIDPYLCHGSGTCVSACPTESIRYDLPPAESMLYNTRAVIREYFQQTRYKPVLVIHDTSFEQDKLLADLPEHFLSLSLEQVPIIAVPHLLAFMAWGAERVLLIESTALSETAKAQLNDQVNLANALMAHIQLPTSINVLAEHQLLDDKLAELASFYRQDQHIAAIASADFSSEHKQSLFYHALDHLTESVLAITQSDTEITQIDHFFADNLDKGAISVADDCTLCMGCVASCPTGALIADEASPQLSFVERDCIQCGLCQAACPENVISLNSRVNLNANQRNQPVVLKQEAPFLCITCGQPFATQSMVERMLSTLAEHSAFLGHSERLKMCADCRVKDMVSEVIANPSKQLK
ncbi:4Fe-4S binding protein [Thalassotalea ponticola]|uniref:4Fe-4S binding protein n=1 Tax=Thalassotalea ponticola TaxID=1523392 RepID=UPI0025B32D1B|nr:4Fe-4S dicluster domain-containing protein [Thalassotalea ponticola]MDN3653962.1 4Fe-4S binding protein [Thalassotalea ponticola]